MYIPILHFIIPHLLPALPVNSSFET